MVVVCGSNSILGILVISNVTDGWLLYVCGSEVYLPYTSSILHDRTMFFPQLQRIIQKSKNSQLSKKPSFLKFQRAPTEGSCDHGLAEPVVEVPSRRYENSTIYLES